GMTEGFWLGREQAAFFFQKTLRPAERFVQDQVALGPTLPTINRLEGLLPQELLSIDHAASSKRQVSPRDTVGASRRRRPRKLGAPHGWAIISKDAQWADARIQERAARERVGRHDGAQDP